MEILTEKFPKQFYFPTKGGKLPQRAVRSLQKASLGDGLATECKASLKISSRDAPIFDAEIKQTLFCVLQISSSEVRSTVGWHNIDMTYERRRSHPRCDSSSPLSHQNVCQLVANITSHGRATAPTSSLQRPMPISRQATRPRCAHLHRYCQSSSRSSPTTVRARSPRARLSLDLPSA